MTLVCPDAAAAVAAGAADADAVRAAGLAIDVLDVVRVDVLPCDVVAAHDAVAVPSDDVVVWAWAWQLAGSSQQLEVSVAESRVHCAPAELDWRAAAAGAGADAAADLVDCLGRRPSHRCQQSNRC